MTFRMSTHYIALYLHKMDRFKSLFPLNTMQQNKINQLTQFTYSVMCGIHQIFCNQILQRIGF